MQPGLFVSEEKYFKIFQPSNIWLKPLTVGWLVVLGLTALWDRILVYIGPSPKERETEERKDRWE